MAQGKKSFILYTDLIHTIDLIDDKQAGILFKHILNYVNDKNPETTDPIIKILFEPIKQTLKRDLEKWVKDAPKRSAKAKKAGLASAEARQLKATKGNSLVELELKATKSTVSDSVNDSVNVKEKNNIPPFIDLIDRYFKDKNSTVFEANKFYSFYSSNGWKVGKNKMIDWHAAASGWISRNESKPNQELTSAQRLILLGKNGKQNKGAN